MSATALVRSLMLCLMRRSVSRQWSRKPRLAITGVGQFKLCTHASWQKPRDVHTRSALWDATAPGVQHPQRRTVSHRFQQDEKVVQYAFMLLVETGNPTHMAQPRLPVDVCTALDPSCRGLPTPEMCNHQRRRHAVLLHTPNGALQ